MDEIWKDVFGYESFYQISNLGRVKRIGKGAGATVGRILTPKVLKTGYVQYGLANGIRIKHVKAHKMVLEAFVCPRPSGLICNHKNGNKGDNRLENLEWMTHSENCRHAFEILGTRIHQGIHNSGAKLTVANVLEIRRLAATGQYTHRQIATRYNVQRTAITRIINRKRWAHI